MKRAAGIRRHTVAVPAIETLEPRVLLSASPGEASAPGAAIPEADDAAVQRPVAHWDVVPDQRFSDVFNVGVVAFHTEGVEVEFSVDGSHVFTAEDPTLTTA